MNPRGAPLRSIAVLGIGAALLAGILFYASTVDGRPPAVVRIGLTQHLASDDRAALTTTSLEVAFSEPVEHASAQAAFVVAPAVAGTFSWSGPVMTFTPLERLPLESSFLVQVAAGVRDEPGNLSTVPSDPFVFQTVGNPAVVASTPADSAESVALDAQIELTFSTLMDTVTVADALSIVPATEVRLRWSGERLTVTPLAPMTADRLYRVRVGTTALDLAGTPLEEEFVLAFRTAESGLAIGTVVPAAGMQGISVHSPVALVLDRPLDPDSVSDDLLTIVPDVAGSLDAVEPPGAAGMLATGPSILRFQPSGALQPNTTYEVTVEPGLLGADGSRLASPISWSFTTGAPSLSLSNQIVFLSDRSGIANLWAMNANGSNQRQLSVELSPVTDYAVAPDGRSFVIGDGAVLVWQSSDGSDRRALTQAALIEFDPAYSPDGGTIVFGRADPATGSGLGLWTRGASGGEPRQVVLAETTPPADESPTPSPTPALPAPLLRAPRLSPDGTRLAFVDSAGEVAILDVGSGEVTRAAFDAAGPPVWMPDGSAILVTGLPDDGGTPPQAAGAPVPHLDPATLGLDPGQIADLRAVRLDPGATAVEPSSLLPRAARIAVGHGPRFAYISLSADEPSVGRLLVTVVGGGASSELLRGGGLTESSVAFAPQPGHLLVARAGSDGRPAGLWLVDLAEDLVEQLAGHGWAPTWLP